MRPFYYELIRMPDLHVDLRYRIVLSAQQIGIRATAAAFHCSRNTVRKWLRRFQQHGKPGLRGHSRQPHRIPHKTSSQLETRVVACRNQIPCYGPKRLKKLFNLSCSTGAIARILKHKQLTRSRKKTRKPKNDLTQQKMHWPAFGRLQVDVKDLIDLPPYKPLIDFGLPRYQFTARIVPEGAIWLAFSAVNDSTYGLLFADRLLAHFKACGVDLPQLTVQTDNGSEFGGNWNRHRALPPFTKLVEQKYGCHRHRFNLPRRSTQNSDVEAVHGIMEPEFYLLERFTGDLQSFLNQAYAFQLYFNLIRENSSKQDKTPDQLRAERAPHIDPKIFFLPPVVLSSIRNVPTPKQVLAGHDVPELLRVQQC